jgi:hypothetical protein
MSPRKRTRQNLSDESAAELPPPQSGRVASQLPNASSSPEMPLIKRDDSNTSATILSHKEKSVSDRLKTVSILLRIVLI